MNGTPGGGFVDVVADYNALYDPDLDPTVDWSAHLIHRHRPDSAGDTAGRERSRTVQLVGR